MSKYSKNGNLNQQRYLFHHISDMTANNLSSTKAKSSQSSLEFGCFSIIARREASQKNSSRHSEDFQFRHENTLFAIYRKREASEDSNKKRKKKEKEKRKSGEIKRCIHDIS